MYLKGGCNALRAYALRDSWGLCKYAGGLDADGLNGAFKSHMVQMVHLSHSWDE